MKAILDESVLVRFLCAFLLPALVLFNSQPAYCEHLSAEQIIERCQAKLDAEEAVLLDLHEDDQFVVIAARNHKLEGELVKRQHIIGKPGEGLVYLYYKPGTIAAVLKLPYAVDGFSQEESMTLKRYYAAKGKIAIVFTSDRSQKIFHPKTSRKAHQK